MEVALRNPDRTLHVVGNRLVREVLAQLTIDPDTVLVIRDGELITRHERVEDSDRAQDRVELVACGNCGQPTTTMFCAFCRARAQILGEGLAAPAEDRQVAEELADEVLPAEIYAGGAR